MPDRTYSSGHLPKRLRILGGELKTPPMSHEARRLAGGCLRAVQDGGRVPPPVSKPLPSLGRRCHELRIDDGAVTWRVLYRVDPDVVLVGDVFAKKTERLPRHILAACRKRFAEYDRKRAE
jgi:phage-related protein